VAIRGARLRRAASTSGRRSFRPTNLPVAATSSTTSLKMLEPRPYTFSRYSFSAFFEIVVTGSRLNRDGVIQRNFSGRFESRFAS
jgi:hypothetical protein